MSAISSKAVKRGCFILFEGVDRCGKTTQCQRLVEFLKQDGRAVEFMRFPERSTVIGKTINSYLTNGIDMNDEAIHLLFSANRWELSTQIKEKLAAGVTLVVDRYAYSGVAFSASKPGMDLEWCKAPDEGLLAPDVVLFMDLTIEQAMQRGQFGEERYEKEEFQRTVRETFLALKNPSWKIIDASKSIEEVEQSVRAAALTAIEEASKGTPLKTLWGQ
jgi:dTMP kinase|eukprot:g7419.t1